MTELQRFSFTERLDAFGVPDALPQLPLSLTYRDRSVDVSALLDTGASVNVLPYSIGVQLGAVWEEQTTSVILAGNLAAVEARGLLVSATIGAFDPLRLVFAWSVSDDAPLLLGRMNFFLEFDVCFYRSQLVFEVRPKAWQALMWLAPGRLRCSFATLRDHSTLDKPQKASRSRGLEAV